MNKFIFFIFIFNKNKKESRSFASEMRIKIKVFAILTQILPQLFDTVSSQTSLAVTVASELFPVTFFFFVFFFYRQPFVMA